MTYSGASVSCNDDARLVRRDAVAGATSCPYEMPVPSPKRFGCRQQRRPAPAAVALIRENSSPGSKRSGRRESPGKVRSAWKGEGSTRWEKSRAPRWGAKPRRAGLKDTEKPNTRARSEPKTVGRDMRDRRGARTRHCERRSAHCGTRECGDPRVGRSQGSGCRRD